MKATRELQDVKSRQQNWAPILEVATREVFELMLGCRLDTPETPVEEPLDTTSMVGLAGRLCGVISIRCNHKSAGLMASKMLGVEVEKIGSEVCDAFGEICNMIAGNFKNKITGLGNGCLLSVPTVITGNDYSLYSMADLDSLEVRLLFENMLIVVSLQVHS